MELEKRSLPALSPIHPHRQRFTPDSQTAYLVTAVAPAGLVADRCFLYAIGAAGSTSHPPPPPATKLRSTSITLSARERNGVVTVSGDVTVADEKGSAAAGAAVRGAYRLTVTNITKTGYLFDSAGSVLTRSITK